MFVLQQVLSGVDFVLFNLLVLGSVTDRDGFVWRRSPLDLYVIETMPLMQREVKTSVVSLHYDHRLIQTNSAFQR